MVIKQLSSTKQGTSDAAHKYIKNCHTSEVEEHSANKTAKLQINNNPRKLRIKRRIETKRQE
jgi:hypothetical protein